MHSTDLLDIRGGGVGLVQATLVAAPRSRIPGRSHGGVTAQDEKRAYADCMQGGMQGSGVQWQPGAERASGPLSSASEGLREVTATKVGPRQVRSRGISASGKADWRANHFSPLVGLHL